jgi:1,4-dihydroxy-2-naphthoate octaprenyltransferase
MTQSETVSSLEAWRLAVRPKTLPAALAPVLVGIALALSDKVFAPLPALAAMAGALLLQIGVNLANDYFDFKKGIDSVDRLGPIRVTQTGLISPKQVIVGIVVTFGCSILIGFYLVMVGGWPILMVGGASILSALAYSGGPCPMASLGLGDLFVFIFFGLVAVCGTYYVQALSLTWLVMGAAVPVGFLITAILVVNNLRDIEGDARAGKRTLAVRLGVKGSRMEYVLLLFAAYAVPVILWLIGARSMTVLLPLLSIPLAIPLGRLVGTRSGPVLNKALASTARLALLYSILFGVGLLF